MSVDSEAGLAAAVESVRSQTLDVRQAWAARARAYVRDYYDLSSASREVALAEIFERSNATETRPVHLGEEPYHERI